MAKKKENVPAKAVESLFNKVSNLIEQARVRVAAAINVAEVYTKISFTFSPIFRKLPALFLR